MWREGNERQRERRGEERETEKVEDERMKEEKRTRTRGVRSTVLRRGGGERASSEETEMWRVGGKRQRLGNRRETLGAGVSVRATQQKRKGKEQREKGRNDGGAAQWVEGATGDWTKDETDRWRRVQWELELCVSLTATLLAEPFATGATTNGNNYLNRKIQIINGKFDKLAESSQKLQKRTYATEQYGVKGRPIYFYLFY